MLLIPVQPPTDPETAEATPAPIGEAVGESTALTPAQPASPTEGMPEWFDTIEIAEPVTLGGIGADLLIHAPPRYGRSWLRYYVGLAITALTSSGFHMMLAYRIGAWFHRLRLRPLCLLVEKFIFHWYYCVIPCSARIGPGLWVPHPLGIVLNSRARLGAGVYLRQHAEVVHIWEDDMDRSGLVGDRAQLSSGCILLRGAVVGHDCIVAARAVVTKPIPPKHLAIGMPAKASPLTEDKLPDRAPRWQ
ncbi:MAG: hypothetical protein AAGJ46_02010 [Planctomycetota bacterium]